MRSGGAVASARPRHGSRRAGRKIIFRKYVFEGHVFSETKKSLACAGPGEMQ
jgi:hypothetical protein